MKSTHFALFGSAVILLVLAGCVPPEKPGSLPTLDGVTITGNKATVKLPPLAEGQSVVYDASITRGNKTQTAKITWTGIAEEVNGTKCVGWTKMTLSPDSPEDTGGIKRLYCESGMQYDYILDNSEPATELAPDSWMLREARTLDDYKKATNPVEKYTGTHAIEDVTVRAGTYRALKTTTTSASRNVTDWHSPNVPFTGLVKSIETQTGPNALITYELVGVQ